jgi:Na+(H+)/acetate symporter ActP
MKHLRIIVPVVATVGMTVGAIFLARWLTGLVPAGTWSELIKAGIIIFVIVCALVIIAWSAYFTYIIRRDIESGRTEK